MAEVAEKLNPEKLVASKNWRLILQKIITGFVLLFCFIIFPVFFIHSSLTIIFKNNTDALRQEKLLEMAKTLEYLEKYSSNKKYFHYLMTNISEGAEKSSNPQEFLRINIENLKNKYPDSFEFVVWDKDGKVIKELTDKKGYGYVLGKLYSTLKEVKKAVDSDVTVKVSNLSSVKQNLNLLRNFLGRIFVAENLKYPIVNSQEAGPMQTELGNGLVYSWYYPGEKISLFCFLSEPLVKDFSGLVKICNTYNSKNNDIITGYTMTPDYIFPVTNFPVAYNGDLSLALSVFENSGDSNFENQRAIIRLAMPQPNVRTFCFLPKKDDIWDYEYKRDLWFWIISSALLLTYCLLGFWFHYKRHFFSIRWKLTALFLFANLAPVCILGFIAKGYIENKQIALKNEIVGDLEKKLREFDARYRSLMDDYTIRLNEKIDAIANRIGNKPIQQSDIDQLKQVFRDFEGNELLLVASSGQLLERYCEEVSASKKLDFMASIANAMLVYANAKVLDRKTQGGDVFASVLNPDDSEIIRYTAKNMKKVMEFEAGEYAKIYYAHLIGDSDNFNNNYFYMITWDRWNFQNIFMKKSFKTLSTSFPEAEFFVKSKDGKVNLGTNSFNSDLLSIFEKNSGMTEKNSGSVFLYNKQNIFVCLNATNMQGEVLLALYPETRINKEINLILMQIIAGILISLLLTIIIGHILSLQFLKPIHNLGEAALAIGERKFSYRLPIGDKDEFGHLNQVFNQAIEGLADFEVARIIQESLFPGNHFDVGDFDIFGKSVVMTTLGGDYYDCFKINDEYQGIIIGDVAGHGIPAGLMMAMAKSGVLTAPDEIKLDPTALTTRLHKTFHAIKNDKLKRMMTFMYYVLRVSDGHFCYTNAGHCFPIIVDGDDKTATFMDYIATPLGIGPKCRCKNQEFDIQKGQSLILYTDGIVEAANEYGEQFGYDRFKEALVEYYDPDPEVYYYNLYEKVYKKWSPKPDDDLTLIIVNRN